MNKKTLSFEEVMAMIAGIAERQEALTKGHEEFARELKEVSKRQEESNTKFESWLAESAREFDKRMKVLDKKIGDIGGSNGKVAVDLIFNKFKKRKVFGGIVFDRVLREIRRVDKDKAGDVLDGEYDIILLNGSAVALIDVKYRVRGGDIDYLENKQLAKFRALFPEYKKSKVYLGLGGMSFQDGILGRI